MQNVAAWPNKEHDNKCSAFMEIRTRSSMKSNALLAGFTEFDWKKSRVWSRALSGQNDTLLDTNSSSLSLQV